MDIQSIIENGSASVTIQITARDLKDFANHLFETAVRKARSEQASADGELMQLRKWLITIYREMRRAGTNLNQATKAINAIKYRFKLGFEGEEEYRQAVYMTGYAAEKLSWRSKDVHEVAMKILCEYLPEDE